MVTVNVQRSEFPELSTMVYVIVVDPTAKSEPGGGPILEGMRSPSQLSGAVGSVQEMVLLQALLAVLLIMLLGHFRTGFSLSNTVIVNEQLTGPFPELSVAV